MKLTLVLFLVGVSAAVALKNGLRATPKETEAMEKTLAHLEAVSAGLEKMVNSKDAAMAKLKPSLQSFSAELKQTIKEVKTDKSLTDAQKADKIKHAQNGVEELTHSLTNNYQDLQRQGDEEKESLLMGVLMTRQKLPLGEQLQVLGADDFKNLPVAKALLQKHTQAPLFQQVAAFLDGGKPTNNTVSVKPHDPEATKTEAKDAALQKVTTLLQGNLQHLEASLKNEEALHKKSMATLENAMKDRREGKDAVKDKKKLSHLEKVYAAMKKQETRKYEKWHAIAVRDVESLKKSISGIQKGDIKAVETARSALAQSLQAMQEQMGGFLHFLQTSVTTLRRGQDCPYCAAQCLEKCHTNGKSYVTCMTDCADAGKR